MIKHECCILVGKFSIFSALSPVTSCSEIEKKINRKTMISKKKIEYLFCSSKHLKIFYWWELHRMLNLLLTKLRLQEIVNKYLHKKNLLGVICFAEKLGVPTFFQSGFSAAGIELYSNL